MSGGAFEYFQRRYNWDEVIERLQLEINENPNGYSELTLSLFSGILRDVKAAQKGIDAFDMLICSDIGEETFIKRMT